MALQLWETLKESITVDTGLSPASFLAGLALGLVIYYVLSSLFGSADRPYERSSRAFQVEMQPLPPPVQIGEITEEELKIYDGSDSTKPLLMGIKGQIYDVSQSRISETEYSRGGGTSGKSPSFVGIRCGSDKWVSEIREPQKTTRMPEMAATAYDVAALALKGPDAALNFPEAVLSYPVLASLSACDIRAAAASAATVSGLKAMTDESSTVAVESGKEFLDEDALFDMPNLLVDMAEGMLMSPPRIITSPPSDEVVEDSDGVSLWSYY